MTEAEVWQRLKTAMDPELNENIVDLGLVYQVDVTSSEKKDHFQVHILLTLTTPGCPLAGMFQFILRDALRGLDNFDPETDLDIELTFDPPWTQDMMSDELKAKFGTDEW